MPEPTTTEQPVEQPQPPKVTPFDEAQKARINEIVADARARAASEARADERLKAAPPSTAEPISDTLLRLATTEAELTSLKTESAESKVREVLHKAVSGQQFFDPELASQILKSSVKMIDGKPIVVDANGAPRLNAEFNAMSPADLAAELANNKPFLVRSSFQGGAGSTMGSRAEVGPRLDTLFGKLSSGMEANKLAMRNPAQYKILRARAVKEGLLIQ